MEDIQFQKKYASMIGPNYPVSQISKSAKALETQQNGTDFSQLFLQKVQQNSQLTFSKHALQRLDSRQIQLSPQMLAKINGGVEKAKAKGIKDALILSGPNAFIVNIPSGTVITTMSGQEMTDNVFTNIDGAVIV